MHKIFKIFIVILSIFIFDNCYAAILEVDNDEYKLVIDDEANLLNNDELKKYYIFLAAILQQLY